MKTKNIYTTISLLMVFSIVLFGCKKDDEEKTPDPNPVVTPTTSDLEIHFHTKVGNEVFALGQDYQMMVGGETITYSFSYTAFYVSGISLSKMEGGSKDLADTYLLVKPEQEEYQAGEIDAVHYTGISFNVGIDEATNHLDPASYPADHPLAPKNPTMHWSWNPGYRFLVLEGDYSSTDNQSGKFVFHIGLDEYLSNVNLPFDQHLKVEGGVEATVHLEVDYSKFFEGIDLRTENQTKSMAPSDKPLAQKMVDNIPSAFSLD